MVLEGRTTALNMPPARASLAVQPDYPIQDYRIVWPVIAKFGVADFMRCPRN